MLLWRASDLVFRPSLFLVSGFIIIVKQAQADITQTRRNSESSERSGPGNRKKEKSMPDKFGPGIGGAMK